MPGAPSVRIPLAESQLDSSEVVFGRGGVELGAPSTDLVYHNPTNKATVVNWKK